MLRLTGFARTDHARIVVSKSPPNTLRLLLCLAFGSEQSFGTADYYEVRGNLELPDGRTPMPDMFVRAFLTK